MPGGCKATKPEQDGQEGGHLSWLRRRAEPEKDL